MKLIQKIKHIDVDNDFAVATKKRNEKRRTGRALLFRETGKISAHLSQCEGEASAETDKKLAKSQTRVEIISSTDLQRLENIMHSDALDVLRGNSAAKGLLENPGLAFGSKLFSWSYIRQRGLENAFHHVTKGGKQMQLWGVEQQVMMSELFEGFGISLSPLRNSKERKSAVSKLLAAIKADLLAFDNEQAATMQRMASYWLWAHKRTYNAMVRMNVIFDWATGEKLQEVDESEDEELINIEGENPHGNMDAKMTTSNTSLLPVSLLEELPFGASTCSEVVDASYRDQPEDERAIQIDGNNQSRLQKDDRLMRQTIRPASPTKEAESTPSRPYCRDKRIPRVCEGSPPVVSPEVLDNAFTALKNEVPAPRDEPEDRSSIHLSTRGRRDRQYPSTTQEDFPALPCQDSEATAEIRVPIKPTRILNVTGSLTLKPKLTKHFVKPGASKPHTNDKRVKMTGEVQTTEDAWTDVVGRKGKRK